MAEIALKGNTVHTNGQLPAVGTKAPDFRLTKHDLSGVEISHEPDYESALAALDA